MIYRDYFRMTTDEEQGYILDCCRCCPLHKCELYCQYEQYIVDHSVRATQHMVTVYPASETDIDESVGIPQIAVCIEEVPVPCPSYDPMLLTHGCSMVRNTLIECGASFIADGIGDHYKIVLYGNKYDGYTIPKHNIIYQKNFAEDRWEPTQAVFISAQTGNGKTHFIIKHLSSDIRELNIANGTRYRILFVSNRLALKYQIENQLNNADGESEGLDDEFFAKDAIDMGIDVITYQGFLKMKEKFKGIQDSKSSSRYLFVICDEAHFYTSDAMFNPYTGEILHSIVETFQNAIRIYMSATPYECLDFISGQEYYFTHYDESKRDDYHNDVVLYHFKRNYSYLDIYAFSDTKTLLPEIIKKVKAGEKWLIFLNDKNGGKKFAENIIEYSKQHNCPLSMQGDADKNKKVYVVSAESKSDNSYISMIDKERLAENTYVLISTSVLDNGVNFYGIDNVVVFGSSMVQCLQMAGRARVNRNDPDDRKTLYIKRDSIRDMEIAVERLEKIRKIYHDFNTLSKGAFMDKYIFTDTSNIDTIRHLFFSSSLNDSDTMKYNNIAYSMTKHKIVVYRAILDKMKQEELCDEKVGQAFLNQKFAWFGKHYDEEHDLDLIDEDKAKKEFVAFIEDHIRKGTLFYDIIPENCQNCMAQIDFRTEFREKYDVAYGSADKNKGRTYGKDKINTLFAEQSFPYEMLSEGNPAYWKLIKVEPQDTIEQIE